ncbi:MAG TPA: gamma carbonic anhydrase family protein [Burkholderiaceae bacterium]|jgi:carbonic anhydrase/acetyltransferase-like protein (isoleucine patch superfamily)|nr:gamma carbonic anhydrase family protein [Burkholderiaceae bacterium]
MSWYRIADRSPTLAPSAYVAPGAHVVGLVELADEASIWFGAVLRGDNEPIRIGARSNVQENSVLHTDPGFALTIGAQVTIGHQAMLHGCTIGDGTLIGIQSVILNGARIGRECLIGAGALITEGKEIPDRSVVLGSPGRVVRELRDDEAQRFREIAQGYADRARSYRQHLQRMDGAADG